MNITAETLEVKAIRAEMEAAPDVSRVMALEETGPGAFLYLIETPHSFPRYVIGRTDGTLANPEILRGCGDEENAWNLWRELRAEQRAREILPGTIPASIPAVASVQAFAEGNGLPDRRNLPPYLES